MKYLPAALLFVSTSIVVRAADTDWSRSSDINRIAHSMNELKISAADAGLPKTPPASGQTAAQSDRDLPTPEERAKYKQLLAVNKNEAERYYITRDYLRKCNAVLADHSKAITLPDEPAKVTERFLNAAERARMDNAVDLSIAAQLIEGGVRITP